MKNHKRKKTTRNRDQADKWVDRIADKLGRPVDSRIKPVVAALYAAGFETTGSCQGQIGHGEPAPWVDIGVHAVSPDPRRSARKKTRNLRKQRRLITLLDMFYATHNANVPIRIVLIPFGIEGGVRLTNQAAETQWIEPEKRRRRLLGSFQREFDASTKFLWSQPVRLSANDTEPLMMR